MGTPESKTKLMIKRVLSEMNTYFAMPVGSGYGNAGVPDFLVCCNGWFVGIEAKAGDGRTTLLQEAHLQRIDDAGGYTMVVYETDEAALRQTLKNLPDLMEIRNARNKK